MDIIKNIINFSQKYQKFIIYSSLFLVAVSFFDKALSAAVIFSVFLSVIAFWALNKNKEHAKVLSYLFFIVFLIHLVAVLFIYYFDFDPFGGAGDYILYNSVGLEISDRIHQGNFSLKGLEISNYYPIIVGYIYAFLAESMLLGQIFNAWLVGLSVVFVYLMVVEIGGSKKEGFLTGLIAGFYPSLFFFGSLLLKDAAVVFFSLAALFLIFKLIKNFSAGIFFFFYIVLGVLLNLRIYVGYAAILTFLINFALFSNFNVEKRVKYLIAIIILFGFLPPIFTGNSYLGIDFFKRYLNKDTITYYREVVYAPRVKVDESQELDQLFIQRDPSVEDEQFKPIDESQKLDQSAVQQGPSVEDEQFKTEQAANFSPNGRGSSITIKTGLENPFTFLKNTLLSFINALLGPFIWQIKKFQHLFALPEVITWYFLLFFIIKGIIKSANKQYRKILPLILFSIFIFGTLAIFINNFGIITRIRMPAFLALLCLFSFGFGKLNNIKIPFLEKNIF